MSSEDGREEVVFPPGPRKSQGSLNIGDEGAQEVIGYK